MTDLQVLAPDGNYYTSIAWSTTTTRRFFTGTVPTDASDLEVSIRGGAFSSDPSLISFTASGWIVPNPASYPDGLDLFSGENVVQVRSIPLLGTPSAPATATVYLLAASSLSVDPPSNITVERLDGSVNLSAQGLSDPRVTGYNFYASTSAGGGALGYTRINVSPVSVPVLQQNVVALSALTTNNVAANADPLYVRLSLSQEDLAQNTLQTDLDSRVEIPENVSEIQTDVTISSVETIQYYQFEHRRSANLSSDPATIPVGLFSSLPANEPLYYVVTAIYFDSATQIEYESYFSPEVVANPIDVRIQTQTLPVVTRQQILQDAVVSIYRKDRNISFQPGSVLRDTFLDPFSSEAERIRFILDFIYRASSFDTLLAIDDPFNTGISISPSRSTYKQTLAAAFFLANADASQTVINAAFDKLAANVGITRTPGQRAVGEVRFYTSTTPTASLQVQIGTRLSGGGRSFLTTRFVEIPVAQIASYFNPSTGQYSVRCPIQDENAGSEGNLGPRQISQGAPYGLSVTNDAALFGGTNGETNAQLAARARAALSAVDTGTQQGYLQLAAGVPGVLEASVVTAGSPLMQRDLDPESGEHVGGKVDVWERGLQVDNLTDTFAFAYVRKRDVQFVPVGVPGSYTFQALDSDLSPTNPLAQMLDYPSLGLGLRNATTGLDFDLTNVAITSYNTIQLSLDVPQPAVALTDVVLGDYRYRTGQQFVFTRQPVLTVTSLVGESSGTISPAAYRLVHPNSPLDLGRSTKAGDYLLVTGSEDPTENSPSGAILSVLNEQHTIVGEYIEYVNRLGADSLSVVVTNLTSTVTYNGPYSSGSPDYTIIEGDQTTPLGIKRTSGSAISDGETVLISYSHDENFTVSYQINQVTSALQNAIDEAKHVTADVLAKSAVPVPVDLKATILLQRGVQQSTADQAIRANLGLLFSTLKLGTALRRSDVIATIDATNGVSYVVVPLVQMARAVQSSVIQDNIEVQQLDDTFRVSSWSNVTNAVWLLKSKLVAPTTTGGGPFGQYRAVFQDDFALVLQETLPNQLGMSAGRSYIIGNDGLVIPGYSDDVTLSAQGYNTPEERAARRREITQNRVLVSLSVGDAPSNHSYWATYTVGSSDLEADLDFTDAEYGTPGLWTFTYDEDR